MEIGLFTLIRNNSSELETSYTEDKIMGLDQYAYRREADETADDNITIAEWRKHNRLHGWMEDLHRDRGGDETDTSFNCVEVELTVSDIEQLEAHVENKVLPETTGFFFGGDSYDEYEEYHKETDLNFIKDAYEALADGKKVYYNSWW
jgi:hypothetical protein